MAMLSGTTRTHLPPLFDRLRREGTVLLDEEGLKNSIQQELSWLFNTRYSLKPYIEAITGSSDWTRSDIPKPIAYGLKDFASSTSNVSTKLCEELKEVIRLFEPRLLSPDVKFIRTSDDRQECWVSVSGDVRLGKLEIPINFPITVKVQKD